MESNFSILAAKSLKSVSRVSASRQRGTTFGAKQFYGWITLSQCFEQSSRRRRDRFLADGTYEPEFKGDLTWKRSLQAPNEIGGF